MFGILKALVDVSILGYGAVNDAIENSKSKEKAILDGKYYYHDAHGMTRDVRTDRPVYVGRDYLLNRTVMQDAKTGEILVDFDAIHEKERRAKEEAEKIEKEIKKELRLKELGVVEIEGNGNNPKCLGKKYKDIETGNIYAVRGYDTGQKVFIDENTGEIVREIKPTEEQLSRYSLRFREIMDELISLLNDRNRNAEKYSAKDSRYYYYLRTNQRSMLELYDPNVYKYNNSHKSEV